MRLSNRPIFILLLFSVFFFFVSCSQSEIKEINSNEEFLSIIEDSEDALLVFDLYADWCTPCKLLSPMLEKISDEKKSSARFYKINVDKHPDLARSFGVSGIPFVVFVKNKTAVSALTGLQSKEAYIRVIDQFAHSSATEPDGVVQNGIRVIKRNALNGPGNIHVYRGDEVKVIFEGVTLPYVVNIPAFSIKQSTKPGSNLELEFKAAETGTFPIFCNGTCPDGDNTQIGQIVVMNFEATGKAVFKDLTAAEFKKGLETDKALLLDVRTPGEFKEGHLPEATLIPVQSLSADLGKIASYKETPIYVYCRSGNRSTVAAKILIDNGFKKVYNLRPGIKGWISSGYKTVKPQ